MTGFKSRTASYYEREFTALTPEGNPVDVAAALRQAHALEYIAYHMGAISKKLDQLIERS